MHVAAGPEPGYLPSSLGGFPPRCRDADQAEAEATLAVGPEGRAIARENRRFLSARSASSSSRAAAMDSGVTLLPRSRDQVLRFFAGLDLVAAGSNSAGSRRTRTPRRWPSPSSA